MVSLRISPTYTPSWSLGKDFSLSFLLLVVLGLQAFVLVDSYFFSTRTQHQCTTGEFGAIQGIKTGNKGFPTLSAFCPAPKYTVSQALSSKSSSAFSSSPFSSPTDYDSESGAISSSSFGARLSGKRRRNLNGGDSEKKKESIYSSFNYGCNWCFRY